jgi:hypothetical protein
MSWRHHLALPGLLALTASRVQAQLTQAQINDLSNVVGDRIEAAVILGGDYGFSGATYRVAESDNLSLKKFGGGGEIGDPKPWGDSSVRWRPRLQGEAGQLNATDPAHLPQFSGAESDIKTYTIEFGGGIEFWFGDYFRVTPTITGMYGHTASDYHPNGNAAAAAAVPQGEAAGLINFTAATWTLRPDTKLEWEYDWGRTIFKFSTTPVFFHTQSFQTSNSNLKVNNNSETWYNEIDVDIPLGKQLFGRELRTGGYFGRKEIFGDLRDGLDGLPYIYDIHGRIVLDTLDKVKWTKWIGLGASYYWGPGITGKSYGVDIYMVF